MAIIRGSTQSSGSANTVLNLVPEAGTTDGEILVAVIGQDTGDLNTISAPDETWVPMVTSSLSGFPHAAGAFWKVVTGSPAASYPFTSSGTGQSMVGTLTTINPQSQTLIAETHVYSGSLTPTSNDIRFYMAGGATPNVLIGSWIGDDAVAASTGSGEMTLEEFVGDGGLGMVMTTYSQLDAADSIISRSYSFATNTERYAIGILFTFQAVSNTSSPNHIIYNQLSTNGSKIVVNQSSTNGSKIKIHRTYDF